MDPLPLGRSVVVDPGVGAPAPWDGCERVVVDAVDADLAGHLDRAWRERRPVVVELHPGLGLDDAGAPPPEVVTGKQPWELGVDLDLVADRLHHAVWANSIDGRGAEELRWRWADAAVPLGATPGGVLDVLLPDGTPVVCDGGPLDAGLPGRLGAAVVHSIGIEHGSLAPIGPNRSDAPLAPDQLAAVTHAGGGARVIAPAGSGKTRVLTERCRTLLRSWALPTSALAVVAFNRRAADELRSRTTDLPGLRIRTLNALGLRLLPDRIRTVEELRARDHLGHLVAFPRRAETDPAAPWLEALGRVRLALRSPAAVEAELPDVTDLDSVARAYRARLHEAGEADFDEQVVGAIERLLADPPFRWRAQRFARVLLVDEFQDLTPAHVLLLRLLTGPAGSVFGVGDDDQTIYGYAGATPRWLVDFEQEFPGSGSHALEVNYRCPPAVVTAASNLLTRNAVRVPKAIRPAPGALDEPGALRVLPAGPDPAGATAARVAELVGSGVPTTEVAVLARVNAALAPVQVLLRHGGIGVKGGVDARFLNRGGVRAALAWLAVAAAPDRAIPGAMLRDAARRPKRGMSDSLLKLVEKQRSVRGLADLAVWLDSKGSARESGKVTDLALDVAAVRKAADGGTTADVLAVVRHEIGAGGLDVSAAALDGWSQGAIAAHGDDLDALVSLATLEPDPSGFGPWLAAALSVGDDDDGVTLASIHAVKGQEWPHVIVHQVIEGILPHRLVDDDDEERRVFHVAITRGRQTVTVVPGRPPSRFLNELATPGAPAPAQPSQATRPASKETPARADDDTTPVAAAVGTRFDHGGYEHEIVEVAASGVRTSVGGSATTTLPFGSRVRTASGMRVLAHPAFEASFERLRAWRGERAAGKPAYTVFADATLRAIAGTLPTTEGDLRRIKGVGPTKLELYGEELLALTSELRAVTD